MGSRLSQTHLENSDKNHLLVYLPNIKQIKNKEDSKKVGSDIFVSLDDFMGKLLNGNLDMFKLLWTPQENFAGLDGDFLELINKLKNLVVSKELLKNWLDKSEIYFNQAKKYYIDVQEKSIFDYLIFKFHKSFDVVKGEPLSSVFIRKCFDPTIASYPNFQAINITSLALVKTNIPDLYDLYYSTTKEASSFNLGSRFFSSYESKAELLSETNSTYSWDYRGVCWFDKVSYKQYLYIANYAKGRPLGNGYIPRIMVKAVEHLTFLNYFLEWGSFSVIPKDFLYVKNVKKGNISLDKLEVYYKDKYFKNLSKIERLESIPEYVNYSEVQKVYEEFYKSKIKV